jgi:phage-related protein
VRKLAYDIGPKIGIEGEKEFRNAISQINMSMKTLGTEMQAVTSQFDKGDKSTKALTAQNEVLNKQIDVQKQKLAELQKGLAAAAEKYGENDKVTQGWQQAVNKATADLNNMERELKENEAALSKTEKGLKIASKTADDSGHRFEKLGKVLKASAAAMGAVAVAAGAAAIKLSKDVIQSFGELEQNLGGSEAVFGEYAKSIQKTGEEAYKNLGVSQSEYLATANKMGALFQGSGIEQQKSLELTEKAMQRAADMASVMGIDMSMAMESVAGAAKGNFTMMDNLGVAMNATTIEAYALAKGLDFTWASATNAEKAEIAMQMFFEKTEQYAGNFARESTETISGSIGLMKAALGSFTAGLGNANADMTSLTQNLVDAFQAVVKNIVPVLENIVAALPAATGAIISAVGDLLPTLLEMATEIFDQVLGTILNLFPELIPAAVDAVMTIAGALINNVHLIISAAVDLVMALVEGIGSALPELIPAAVDAVMTIVDTIIDNIDKVIGVTLEIIIALTDGLIAALPNLIEKVPEIVKTIVQVMIENLPLIIDAAIQIIVALAGALIENLPLLIKSIPEVIKAMYEGLKNGIGTIIKFIPELFTSLKTKIGEIEWRELGSNIIGGIVDGIKNAAKKLADSVVDAAKSALSKTKSFLQISSPSAVMRDQVGKMIGLGIAEGITDSKSQVEAAMARLSKDLIVEGSMSYTATTPSFATQTRSIPKQEFHLHIGTLIADDYGLKQLERKLMSIRIGETARLGGEPA